jgi:nitrogen fixation/metabolism regulation signal transduction histidine kinase
MVYKQNTLFLVLRLMVILAVMMTIPFITTFIERDQLIFTYLVIALILGILVFELIRFTNRSNRELTEFLQHILNRDFNLSFNVDKAWGSRKDLYRTFNDVLQTYKEIKIEKEVQFRFLDHIVELIEVGIMVLDQHNRVVLINSSAEALSTANSPGTWEQVRKKNRTFADAVDQVKGPQRVLCEFRTGQETTRLVIHVNRTSMLEEPYILITFQDLGSVAEDMETGAWVKLMRILNHEIRNSITPISSLTETIIMILQHENGRRKEPGQISPQNLSDIMTSLEALQQRCDNLLQFISDYQKLTKIPAPSPVEIELKSFLEEIHSLFSGELEKRNIKFNLETESANLIVRADRNLLQQVLFNLVKNSMEALENVKDPLLIIRILREGGQHLVSIEDNGTGIEADIMDEIFVPFYTTKPQGSGIGLSLARQIMRMHGGNIRISSKPGEGTVVYLDFQGLLEFSKFASTETG